MPGRPLTISGPIHAKLVACDGGETAKDTVTDTLEHIIYAGPPASGQLLGLSAALSVDDAAAWRALVNLDAPPGEPGAAVGVFSGAGRGFLVARATAANGAGPVIECLTVPRGALAQAAGGLEPLLALLDTAPPPLDKPFTAETPQVLPAYELPNLPPWAAEDRLAAFQALLANYAGDDFLTALSLLGAALDTRGLLIVGWPGGWRRRLRLVQGLMALLPAPARAELTFSTHAAAPGAPAPRVIFAAAPGDSARRVASLPAAVLDDDTLLSPYITLLADMWTGDPESYIAALAEMDLIAEHLLAGGADLTEELIKVAGRMDLNHRVLANEHVPSEVLKSVFSGRLMLSPALYRRYAERLLAHALEARDTEAALIVAQQMDMDPALDKALSRTLDEALKTQPDAVYVFVRARLSDTAEVSTTWLERLHAAAAAALEVAVNDGDEATLANWLRLIAREPASYRLRDALHQGILAAQARAHADGELARLLLGLAVKHDTEALEPLLTDTALLAAIPENLGLVLRDYAGDPLATLQARGPEMFTVALALAAEARAAQQFTPAVNEEVWRLYTAGPALNLPARYQPDRIVEAWAATGAEWLPTAALEHLLKLILADGHDALFTQLAHGLAARARLEPLLSAALQASQRSPGDVLTLVSQLVSAHDLSQQAAVSVCLELADRREWRQAALPLVEQAVRLMQQNPALDVAPETAWHMLELAARARTEPVARAAARQLCAAAEALAAADDPDADTALMDLLGRLIEQLQWSYAARQHTLSWWRDFVRRQPIAHLARFDKLLESRRGLDDVRSILQTTLAFRRMLGKRSWQTFASDINTAFAILEDLAESFEPSRRRPFTFDQDTVRAELDAHEGALSDQEQRILARNFKELAQIIGEMGDHRSRASLMRRGDEVDRHLMAGEQQPSGAVDVMKWMAGYLDGAQDSHEEDG